MGLQTLIPPKLGEMQMVPSVGENCVQGHLPGNAVIPMPGQVSPVRLGADHHLRLHPPDLPHDLLSEFGGVF